MSMAPISCLLAGGGIPRFDEPAVASKPRTRCPRRRLHPARGHGQHRLRSSVRPSPGKVRWEVREIVRSGARQRAPTSSVFPGQRADLARSPWSGRRGGLYPAYSPTRHHPRGQAHDGSCRAHGPQSVVSAAVALSAAGPAHGEPRSPWSSDPVRAWVRPSRAAPALSDGTSCTRRGQTDGEGQSCGDAVAALRRRTMPLVDVDFSNGLPRRGIDPGRSPRASKTVRNRRWTARLVRYDDCGGAAAVELPRCPAAQPTPRRHGRTGAEWPGS